MLISKIGLKWVLVALSGAWLGCGSLLIASEEIASTANQSKLTSDQVGVLWDNNSNLWIELVDGGHDLYREYVTGPAFLKTLPNINGLQGLDVGCGHGYSTRPIAKLGAKMTGIDISRCLIDEAGMREKQTPLGIRYLTGDANNLPFQDSSFDFSTAFFSLMDLPDAEIAIQEVVRVLKPGRFLQLAILHPCFCNFSSNWKYD